MVKSKAPSYTWKHELTKWEDGSVLTYPSSMSQTRFFWETAPLTSLNSPFKQRFVKAPQLKSLKEDYSAFQSHFKNLNPRTSVVSFWNKSGDTRLIVPVPLQGHTYTTLKEFIDTAPRSQRIAFWKKAAKEIKKLVKVSPLWVSTHGLGVPFLHLRISDSPKYFKTPEFF